MTHSMTFAKPATALALTFVLSACLDPQVTRAPHSPSEAAIGPLIEPVTVDSAQGTCFARATTPAVIETVTEQVIVQPAATQDDGTVVSPATFRTNTHQRILRERREVEFETPCADVQTPQFLASIQRALLARGYYRGPITGQENPALTSALERFQTDQDDVQTGQLTLKTARTLGLVALPRDEL